MSKPEIGKPAPAFSAPATGDQILSLKDFNGKNLVLYFYPKDNTPGCIKQGEAFRDLYSEFQKHDTDIVGVSRESIKSHENFKKKREFPFDLLSDPEETVCKAYDVIRLKKMYGKEFMGVERSTFLIDKKGKLQHEWRKVKVKDHAQDVLDKVKAL